MQRIAKEVFGEHEGKTVHLFRLTNANGMTAELIEFGGRIKGLSLPAGQGKLDNMSVGFDTLEPYVRFNPWFGAVVGRTASRIAGASFELDGVRHQLSVNGPGNSNMHGGFKSFDKVVWSGEAEEDGDGATLKLRYTAADGEEGFPGKLDVTVTYRLDDQNRFHLCWDAVTDKPTIVDMTSHVYLNLNGFQNRNALNEHLKVNAAQYLEKDEAGIPTGTMFDVAGTPFDLRSPVLLEQVSNGAVFNPIMKLDGEGMREVAEVSVPESGRSYKLFTTGRALQVYNAYNVPQFFANNGLESPYGNAPGLCLEPQNYPNAINIPALPSPILRPGEVYSERQFFAFNW